MTWAWEKPARPSSGCKSPPEARWALLSVVDQAEAMTAVGGADLRNWMDGIGLFSHRTPLANDAGIEILRGFADSPLEGSGFRTTGSACA